MVGSKYGMVRQTFNADDEYKSVGWKYKLHAAREPGSCYHTRNGNTIIRQRESIGKRNRTGQKEKEDMCRCIRLEQTFFIPLCFYW